MTESDHKAQTRESESLADTPDAGVEPGSVDPNAAAAAEWERIRCNPNLASRWDWHALLRLIQCAYPGQHPIGQGITLEEDPVRLGQVPYLHPPPVEVADVRSTTRDGNDLGATWLLGYQLGLFGPMGPLPLHLTEHARRGWFRGGNEADALAAFANVLNHRFLSYAFRAWSDIRKEVDWDRADEHAPTGSPGFWLWSLYVGSLIGIGMDSFRSRDRVPDAARFYFAGRLLMSNPNEEGLKAILEEYFEVPVQVIPFVARTLEIPEASRWRLGDDETGGLGLSAILGEHTAVVQDGFRIRFGPLTRQQFESLLPGTKGAGELADWIRFYVGPHAAGDRGAGICPAWDVHLILKADAVPDPALGEHVKLGWTCWLPGRPKGEDAKELVLQPDP